MGSILDAKRTLKKGGIMAADDGGPNTVSFHVFGPVNAEAGRIVVHGSEDLDHGAQYKPKKVGHAQQAGKEVVFMTNCGSCCWYWKFPFGSRIYHCEKLVREDIARRNGRMQDGRILRGKAGSCPHCGNPYTNGEKVWLKMRLIILNIINWLKRF